MEQAALAHRSLLPVGERNAAIDGRPARFKGLRSSRAHRVMVYHYSKPARKIANAIERLLRVDRARKRGGTFRCRPSFLPVPVGDGNQNYMPEFGTSEISTRRFWSLRPPSEGATAEGVWP